MVAEVHTRPSTRGVTRLHGYQSPKAVHAGADMAAGLHGYSSPKAMCPADLYALLGLVLPSDRSKKLEALRASTPIPLRRPPSSPTQLRKSPSALSVSSAGSGGSEEAVVAGVVSSTESIGSSSDGDVDTSIRRQVGQEVAQPGLEWNSQKSVTAILDGFNAIQHVFNQSFSDRQYQEIVMQFTAIADELRRAVIQDEKFAKNLREHFVALAHDVYFLLRAHIDEQRRLAKFIIGNSDLFGVESKHFLHDVCWDYFYGTEPIEVDLLNQPHCSNVVKKFADAWLDEMPDDIAPEDALTCAERYWQLIGKREEASKVRAFLDDRSNDNYKPLALCSSRDDLAGRVVKRSLPQLTQEQCFSILASDGLYQRQFHQIISKSKLERSILSTPPVDAPPSSGLMLDAKSVQTNVSFWKRPFRAIRRWWAFRNVKKQVADYLSEHEKWHPDVRAKRCASARSAVLNLACQYDDDVYDWDARCAFAARFGKSTLGDVVYDLDTRNTSCLIDATGERQQRANRILDAEEDARLLRAKAVAEQERQTRAAVRVQAAFRGFLGRRVARSYKEGIGPDVAKSLREMDRYFAREKVDYDEIELRTLFESLFDVLGKIEKGKVSTLMQGRVASMLRRAFREHRLNAEHEGLLIDWVAQYLDWIADPKDELFFLERFFQHNVVFQLPETWRGASDKWISQCFDRATDLTTMLRVIAAYSQWKGKEGGAQLCQRVLASCKGVPPVYSWQSLQSLREFLPSSEYLPSGVSDKLLATMDALPCARVKLQGGASDVFVYPTQEGNPGLDGAILNILDPKGEPYFNQLKQSPKRNPIVHVARRVWRYHRFKTLSRAYQKLDTILCSSAKDPALVHSAFTTFHASLRRTMEDFGETGDISVWREFLVERCHHRPGSIGSLMWSVVARVNQCVSTTVSSPIVSVDPLLAQYRDFRQDVAKLWRLKNTGVKVYPNRVLSDIRGLQRTFEHFQASRFPMSRATRAKYQELQAWCPELRKDIEQQNHQNRVNDAYRQYVRALGKLLGVYSALDGKDAESRQPRLCVRPSSSVNLAITALEDYQRERVGYNTKYESSKLADKTVNFDPSKIHSDPVMRAEVFFRKEDYKNVSALHKLILMMALRGYSLGKFMRRETLLFVSVSDCFSPITQNLASQSLDDAAQLHLLWRTLPVPSIGEALFCDFVNVLQGRGDRGAGVLTDLWNEMMESGSSPRTKSIDPQKLKEDLSKAIEDTVERHTQPPSANYFLHR